MRIDSTVQCRAVRFSLSQELRQEQRQILTQRMIQSMEILQLTLQQLEQRIEQELEQNPVLELEADVPSSDTGAHSDTNPEEEPISDNEREPEIKLDQIAAAPGATEEFSIADEFAQNYSDTIDEAPIRSQNWLEDQEMLRADAFANIESPGDTLQTHLLSQLDWFDISEPLREMCLQVINNLDPSGYFPYELADILGENYTKDELKLAGEALALVKRLEPTGVGGKDLRECLLLQIDPNSDYAEILSILITSYLEDISANRLPSIAKRVDRSLDTIQAAVAELRHFNPRPGAAFGAHVAPIVIPDIFVEKNENGKYVARLEEGRTPQLCVNSLYRDLLRHGETDKETKTYIRKKIGAARWLIDAIEQRRVTLLKVSQAIVDFQTDFFEQGMHALKPLRMQQVAEVIDMHVTTVSRACDDKWLASPQGIFPLRRFFAIGLTAADGGEEMANDVVQLKIQEIINREDKMDPMTDDAISKILESEGVQVARRTVMKYRKLLNIPSSHGRRQWD